MLRLVCGVVVVLALCLAAYSLFIDQILWLFACACVALLIFGGIFFIQSLEK